MAGFPTINRALPALFGVFLVPARWHGHRLSAWSCNRKRRALAAWEYLP